MVESLAVRVKILALSLMGVSVELRSLLTSARDSLDFVNNMQYQHHSSYMRLLAGPHANG